MAELAAGIVESTGPAGSGEVAEVSRRTPAVSDLYPLPVPRPRAHDLGVVPLNGTDDGREPNDAGITRLAAGGTSSSGTSDAATDPAGTGATDDSAKPKAPEGGKEFTGSAEPASPDLTSSEEEQLITNGWQ